MRRFRPLASFVFAAVALTAHADWEADIRTRVDKPGNGIVDLKGKMRAKKDWQRMDIDNAKLPMTTIMNVKTRKAWTLLPAQKSVMELDLNQIATNMPACAPEKLEE